MGRPVAFFREAGAGPGVVCLHSNASNSSQWRGLLDMLSPKYRVFAPDCYGSGKSADWASDRTITLNDEVAFIEPVLAAAGDRFSLVGHSYGAAVALIAALAHPGRVRAMALYEPTLFSLIDAQSPPPNAADGIRQAVRAAGMALDEQNPNDAAKHFIDYWMGPSSWDNTPQIRKPPIASSIINVRRWAHALLTEPAPLEAFGTLQIPVLYMLGKNSPPSALEVARLLTGVLPRVEVVELDGLGHMGPITHPQQVNEVIARFIASKVRT
jgi:pimeloyl-ACP methyl ester carboxylesterase